ncbi:F0F1 ATP synthase subunit epsilon [Thiohalorhabdus methylotrophus]|uniref:ATP synthase epsilon chain n=1 Tax=Thiohalorhabdus methylotrophus TaxID=3242694 RepID=A0ABV4TSZ7_9GAMM
MGMTIHVDVVSADREIYSGTSEMVVAPAEEGEVGIMPGHSAFITRLLPGEVRIQHEGKEEEVVFVSGGYLEVQPSVVTVLADTAERAPDIDAAEAEAAKRRAEQALEEQTSDMELARAKAELAEATARLRVYRRHREGAGA